MAGEYECDYRLQMMRGPDNVRTIGYTFTEKQAVDLAEELYSGMTDALKGGTVFCLTYGDTVEMIDAISPTTVKMMRWHDDDGLVIRVWDSEHVHDARVLAVTSCGKDDLFLFDSCLHLWSALRMVETGSRIMNVLQDMSHQVWVVG